MRVSRTKQQTPKHSAFKSTDHIQNDPKLIRDIVDYDLSDFCVVSCFFNPAKYITPQRNFIRFLNDISLTGVDVVIGEVALDDDPSVLAGYDTILAESEITIHQYRGTRFSHGLWQKERIINHLVSNLPPEKKKIAWVDGDVLFLEPYWPQLTSFALDKFPVAQLWGNWYHSDATGKLAEVYSSVGQMGNTYMTKGGHPGGAWAARREAFPIYEHHILGGGDSVTLEGWLGMSDTYCLQQMHSKFRRHWFNWAKEAYKKVAGKVASLPGGAIHLYHGTRANRNYNDRWSILRNVEYNPDTDIEIDSNGLFKFADDRQALREAVQSYFMSRKEDDAFNRPVPGDWFKEVPSLLESAVMLGIKIDQVPTRIDCNDNSI